VIVAAATASSVFGLGLAGLFTVFAVQNVVRDWRDGGKVDPEPGWRFSLAAWRAFRRLSLPALLTVGFGLLPLSLADVVWDHGPTYLAVGACGATFFVTGLALGVSLGGYAIPKVLVPKNLRDWPGYFKESAETRSTSPSNAPD
jgi:hypothetical protein